MEALRLVSTTDLTHDDWLGFRRQGIGGSDCAAICGLSRYNSPLGVYMDKIGEMPPLEDNPRMKAGRKLEPFIADWFAEETGYKVMKRNSIFQHKNHPFMLANIDRWIPGYNAGLEIKNTSEYCKDEWMGTKAPTEYILQSNHYMAVTGAERWFIAVLIGGWDFQWRVIERDDNLINNLITIESNFWEDNVMKRIPPSFSHQDTNYLKERYKESAVDSSVDLPKEAYSIIQDIKDARNAKKNAEIAEETAKNKIKGIMCHNEKAYWQGDLAFTWKANKKGIRSFRVVGGEDE
jgi:putative phage-type endonuclease